jgi:hypothetical protein
MMQVNVLLESTAAGLIVNVLKYGCFKFSTKLSPFSKPAQVIDILPLAPFILHDSVASVP